jgi:hypothetical protein
VRIVGEHMDIGRIVLARWQMKTIESWHGFDSDYAIEALFLVTLIVIALLRVLCPRLESDRMATQPEEE